VVSWITRTSLSRTRKSGFLDKQSAIIREHIGTTYLTIRSFLRGLVSVCFSKAGYVVQFTKTTCRSSWTHYPDSDHLVFVLSLIIADCLSRKPLFRHRQTSIVQFHDADHTSRGLKNTRNMSLSKVGNAKDTFLSRFKF
jgi:hypothetical protein